MIARAASRRFPAALILIVGVVACAARPVPDPQFADCAGDRAVIVSNNGKVQVDVYTTVAGQATPMVIGTVLPGGREQIVLPMGARSVYVRVTEPRQGGWRREAIQIRYICR